jgi:hypothetical protein
MWFAKSFFLFFIKSFLAFLSVGRAEFFVEVQLIDSAGFERGMDFFSKSLPGFVQLPEALGADVGNDFAHLDGQLFINIFQGRPAAHHQVPDRHGEFAGYGAHRQVEGAFAAEEFEPPLGQRMLGAHDGLGGFDQQTAQVFAAVSPDAAGPLFIATVVKGRIEPDVFDELFGIAKAVNVSDQRAQGKGHQIPHPAQADDFQQLGIGQHLLRDQAAPMRPLFVSVTQVQEHPLDDLPLAGCPVLELAQLFGGGVAFGQGGAFFEPHSVVTEIGPEAVARLGGVFDDFAVGVEPVASFLGLGIRHPDDFGGAGQISFADAHGADPVVVGMGFLEFAHADAFQHERPPARGRQGAHDLETVAPSFQHDQICGGGVFLGPTGELGHGQPVEYFFGHGFGRSPALEQCGGEGVGMGIQADHPWIWSCIWVHFILYLVVQADGNRSGALQALRYAGRSPCRCFAPVLIHKSGELLQGPFTSISRKPTCRLAANRFL